MTTTIPTLTVQPIRFTSDVAAWKQFYEALGLHEDSPGDTLLTVLAAGSGQLMLHAVDSESPLAGIELVEFTVPDLDVYAAALESAGVVVVRVDLPHRPGLAIDLPHGRVHVCEQTTSTGTTAFDPATVNLGALVYGDQTVDAAQSIAPYGLTPRIRSKKGAWYDLVGHGMLAFHGGESTTIDHEAPNQPLAQTFLETADVTQYKERLDATGLDVALIDEAYALTLNITQPDGTTLTVNETMKDLYGYQRVEK